MHIFQKINFFLVFSLNFSSFQNILSLCLKISLYPLITNLINFNTINYQWTSDLDTIFDSNWASIN